MRLADTGLTAQDIKDKVKKYMIETYERMDFLCETAKDQYMYDENGEKYLDFYAGIAVIPLIIHTQYRRHFLLKRFVRRLEWIKSSSRTLVLRQTRQ